jgi:hypothetical protein
MLIKASTPSHRSDLAPSPRSQTLRSSHHLIMSSSLNQLWCTLVTANHILDHFSLVTGYGHISARNPLTNTTFFFDPVDPPSLINSNAGYLEWNISNGAYVGNKSVTLSPSSEIWIHQATYKRYPSVNSVVHERSCRSRIPTSLFCPSLIWKPCLVAESLSLISLTTTPQTSRTTSLSTFRTWVQHWQIPSPHPSTM